MTNFARSSMWTTLACVPTSATSSEGCLIEGSLKSEIRRWRALRADERLLILQAMALFPVVAAAVKFRGLRWTQARLGGWAARIRTRGTVPSRPVGQVAYLVLGAARRGPWKANCLQRSLVVWWALRARGETADLRIGVRKVTASAPQFHAWVDLNGQVVNDAEDEVATYVAFDRPITPRGVSFT